MQKEFGRLSRVAFWLVPQRQERQELQSIIARLARQFSAPVFVPHVTIYSCLRSSRQEELALLGKLSHSFQPISMSTQSLASKDRLAQTLFIPLRKTNQANQLFCAFDSEVSAPSGYEFEPHLSLLYQKISSAEREMLLGELTIALNEIRFDQLWAVAIPMRLTSLDDFSGWSPLALCRLDSLTNADTMLRRDATL